jgi:hypothetical protein
MCDNMQTRPCSNWWNMVESCSFLYDCRLHSCTENVRVEILNVGILDSLGQLLGSQDGDVCHFAIEALTGLTEYGTVKLSCVWLRCLLSDPGELRTEILEFGFIDSLQQFLGSDDIRVRHATVQALRALRRYGRATNIIQ